MKSHQGKHKSGFYRKNIVIALALSLMAFWIHHLRMDVSLLNPREDKWLWQTDWAVEYLGWLYFRFQNWAWPLGYLPKYIYPFGASIGTTDSVPLAAYFYKMLSPILGEPFQYFSWWYLLSIFLSGYCSYKILKSETRSRNYSFIASLFFMIAPPLMGRNHHMALSAQWILLLGVGFYLKFAKRQISFRLDAFWIFSFILASSLHPYLWAMYLAIGLASVVEVKTYRIAFSYFLGLALSLMTLWVHGYFRIGDTTNSGFGYYSADLLSFFHPHDLPVLLPNLPHGEGQYEGYSFLGLGSILLLLYVFLRKLFKKEKFLNHSYYPLFVLVFLMWIYALATPVTFAGKAILNLDFIYKHLGVVANTFRSSGRFVWPFYYCLMFWAFIEFFKSQKRQVSQLALFGLLLIQFIDVWRIVDYPRSPDIIYNEVALDKLKEFSKNKKIENLVVVYSDEKELCPTQSFHWEHWYYYPLMAMAAKNDWTVNIGSASRFPWSKYMETCNKTMSALRSGQRDNNTLYVFKPEAYFLYSKTTQGLECGEIEDAHFCYSN